SDQVSSRSALHRNHCDNSAPGSSSVRSKRRSPRLQLIERRAFSSGGQHHSKHKTLESRRACRMRAVVQRGAPRLRPRTWQPSLPTAAAMRGRGEVMATESSLWGRWIGGPRTEALTAQWHMGVLQVPEQGLRRGILQLALGTWWGVAVLDAASGKTLWFL